MGGHHKCWLLSGPERNDVLYSDWVAMNVTLAELDALGIEVEGEAPMDVEKGDLIAHRLDVQDWMGIVKVLTRSGYTIVKVEE
jgi:hypothetical protein